jgi:hypothetical protein
MAVTCPIGFDVASLRAEVETMYSRVATSPDGEFHFHRGADYAATMLGYDATELAALPADVTSSFAGAGNPHAVGRLPARGDSGRHWLWGRYRFAAGGAQRGPSRSRDWHRYD